MLTVKPMSLANANRFVAEHHRHHKPVRGHKFSLGCMANDRLAGVAIVGRPVSRYLDDGLTLEVNRLCTDGTKNACSFLYGAAARAAKVLGYRFEPLDAIRNNGLSVKPENYEQVYTAPLTGQDSLESIYTRFNIDRPADFTGHSLSVSDIVVLHQNGKDTAHYCDRFGFSQVPEFLQPERAAEVTIPTPDQMATQERISTPRGSFCVTAMSREQMEAAGYGVHHQSDDGKYLIMGNGTRAFAIPAQQPEQDNPLRTAEMTLEDDYGMIDGVINNGRRGEELEKAKEHAERTQPEKKPSIRERLAAAKQECAKQQPRPAPEKKPPELGER